MNENELENTPERVLLHQNDSFYRDPETIETSSQYKTYILGGLSIFALLISTALISILLKNTPLENQKALFWGEVSITVQAFLILIIIVFIILDFASKNDFSIWKKYKFLHFYILENRGLIGTFIAVIIFSLIIKVDYIARFILMYDLELLENVKWSCLIVFTTILYNQVINLIVSYTTYVLNTVVYEDRIHNMNKKIEIIKKLNTQITEIDIRDSVEKFFDLLIQNNEMLFEQDILKYLNREEIDEFFMYFDDNESGSITREEFINGYERLINTKKNLKFSIHSSNAKLKKIYFILHFILSPVLLTPFLFSESTRESAMNMFGYVSATIIPLSIVGGVLITEVLRSVFFILFVRPFDIGDFIEYDNKVYQVYDTGLVYSTLKHFSLPINIPNSKLYDNMITNLSRTIFNMEELEFKMEYSVFADKYKKIKERLYDFINFQSRYFQSRNFFIEFSINNEMLATMKIHIKLFSYYRQKDLHNKGKILLYNFFETALKEENITLKS